MDDFIETYDDALPPDLCEALIQRFEASAQKRPGLTGHGLDPSKKDSLDITITGQPDWNDLHQQVMDVTLRCLCRYVRKYPYIITSPLSLSVQDRETGQMRPITADDVSIATDPDLAAYVFHVFRPGAINLQKYRAGTGGYHYWHSEIYPRDPQCETLHRVLLFMFYLNTVEQGGETRFLYAEKTLKPTQGQMVIAPAGFTHTHKGEVPRSSDKYIVTSWILFRRAEHMYANPAR